MSKQVIYKHQRFEDFLKILVSSVSARFKQARVETMTLNLRKQWYEGTACVSEP